MYRKLLLVAAAAISTVAFAQPNDPHGPQGPKPEQPQLQFTTVKEMPITSVKNQASTGTCWCFSTISFLESEILRMGYKGDLDLSEMYVVSKAYQDKAEKYIRVDGNLNFEQGSSSGDVLTVIKQYGIVPDAVMPGLNYGEKRHMHSELCAGLKGYLSGIVKNPNRRLSTAWKNGFKGIVDAYLGECPTEFNYNGKKYTPESYREELKLNIDDYVALTSFTHHPFYTQFALEVCDNWRWEPYYNVPIDELVQIMYNALENGYTIAWASDVSEKGFTRDGVGNNPDQEAVEAAGSDQARWVGADPQQKAQQALNVPEVVVTQASRQEGFDNKTTTDDHGMHIFGLAKDQFGKNYFMVKNSWGESGKYKGVWYVTESFVRATTLDILVHKNAIPKEIRKKLGIN